MESHRQDPILFTSKKDNSVHIIRLTKPDTKEHGKKEVTVVPYDNCVTTSKPRNKVDY